MCAIDDKSLKTPAAPRAAFAVRIEPVDNWHSAWTRVLAFVEKHGAENLTRVAKTHFRTALRAQGLPEPPKVEWRRGSSRGDNEP